MLVYNSPAESGHASSLGLGQALLGVDNPHREELGQQLLRHLYPELVAGVQGLRRKAARAEAPWADKFTDYILYYRWGLVSAHVKRSAWQGGGVF